MKPQDNQDVNSTPDLNQQPNVNSSVATNSSNNFSQPIEATSAQNSNPVNPIDTATPVDTPTISPVTATQVGSIPESQPVTPAVSQSIYPDPSNPGNPRPSQGTLSVEPMQPKKSKKGLIIGLIVAGVLVFLGGGSAAAYTFWYSNPNKVISDAFVNAITAKTAIYTGNLDFSNDSTKVKVDITAKGSEAKGSMNAKLTLTSNDKSYSANGDAIFDDKGDLYFKVDITGIAKELRSQYGTYFDETVLTSYDKLVSQVNNKWIKVSSSDLAKYNESYSKTQDCLSSTTQKYKNDKAAIEEITTLYNKQSFVTVDKELGQKDGSVGYQIKTDKTKLTEFAKGLKDTEIYKSIVECDSSYSIDDALTAYKDSSSDSKATLSVEIWVNSWTHQMTKIALKVEDSEAKLSSEILTKFNEKVDVSAPAGAISINDVMTYFTDFYSSMSSGYSMTDYTDAKY